MQVYDFKSCVLENLEIAGQGRRLFAQETGRFLILGSAGVDLLRQSGESLAGRIAYLELTPFSALEVGPERAALERLWTMLAHRQGGLLNASALAQALEVSTQSVTRHIDLLADLLLVRRLPPLHANVGKRLVKSPKVYIRDSGLVHALLGIPTLTALAGHPVVGRSWEGFVIESLLSVLPWGCSASFYRTSAGAEIDLVIAHPDGEYWAVEIKRSLAATVSRGFHIACRDINASRAFLVHAADDRFSISATLEGIGMREFAAELAGRS